MGHCSDGRVEKARFSLSVKDARHDTSQDGKNLMVPEIERNNWSIVLIGSFNPAIFHPSWFLLNEVISKETAASAEVQVVHSEVASVALGPLRLDVQRNRFSIQTEQAPEITLLDFVLRVFGDLLPHSQINQFGINRTVYFRAPSSEKRIQLGRVFAPPAPWGPFGNRIEHSTGKTLGGMTNVSMREVLIDTAWSGHCEARLMPAYEIDADTGIQTHINNHFELKDYKEGDGAMAALLILKNEFESRMDRCEEIISAVLGHLE
jgi:hypothetical protein